MDRKIFSYNDGESDVFADPTEIDYQIAKLGIEQFIFSPRLMQMPMNEDGTVDFDKADTNDVNLLLDSYHEAEPLIRQAFNIRPFDRATGKGMLFQEVVELFSGYMEWREDIKKNGENPPASPRPTESATSSSPRGRASRRSTA